jgi:hypothetical protein
MMDQFAVDATQKVLDGGGNIDRYLMIVFALVAWWFVRKNLEIVSKNKTDVEALHTFYAKKLEDLNAAHDAQIERINSSNLQNIENVMDKFATERASWVQTQREFTSAIIELSRAIEKRKTDDPIRFHNDPTR